VTTRSVPVTGGSLAVEVHQASTEPVLAIHGVSSNGHLWNWLRAEAPEISLIAPDLRGRAASVDVGGPAGIEQHVADMIAVLDDLGLQRVTVCGMSMGGFIAVALAVAYPHRVAGLMLVDGGFPMPNAGLTPELIEQTFSAQAARVSREFGSVEEYRDFFLQSPNVLDPDDPLLLDYLGHDLDGQHVRLDKDVLVEDATEALLTPPDWTKIITGTRLVYAEWSTGAGSDPAYSQDRVEEFRSGLPFLEHAERIPGVDHGGTIMTRRGSAVVATQLRELLGRQQP
jgi:pimeloyl-ACP methyl ester carboxylesterase